jgi:dolichol-phosphate mannosyltransferase
VSAGEEVPGGDAAEPIVCNPVGPLIVIPTYNEAGNLLEVLERVRAAAPDFDVLIVDDGSPDGTAELAEKANERLGRISVLRRHAKQGLGNAYRAGFRWGLDRGYTALVEMDADLSHEPETLPAIIAALDDADLVIGSRYMPGGSVSNWTFHRRMLSSIGNRYSAGLLGLRVRDLTSGFRGFRREIVERIDLDTVKSEGYGFQIEMAYRAVRAGGRIVEVPIRFADREIGDSKMSPRIAAEALLLVSWWGVARIWRRDRLRARRFGSAGAGGTAQPTTPR